MSARWALVLLALWTCEKQEPRLRTTPARPPATSLAPTAVVDAGAAPEHFACDVRKTVMAHHALNVYRESTRASLELTLAPDGTISGGRGIRSLAFNDGPNVHVQDQRREQQGYRGRWQEQAGTLAITLTPDDATVPQLRAFTNLAPRPWQLTCQRVDHGGPALLCQLLDRPALAYEESYGLEVPGLANPANDPADGRRLLLGAGKGLAITWKASSVEATADRTAEVAIHAAPAAVRFDTWSQD